MPLQRPYVSFRRLRTCRPEIPILVNAMLRVREIIASRSWSTSQEPTSECWWADVLADPRTHSRTQPRASYGRLGSAERAYYGRDATDFQVACTKCDWKAAFARAELIAIHGAHHLASPTCEKAGNQWDRCGVYYVTPDRLKRGGVSAAEIGWFYCACVTVPRERPTTACQNPPQSL
jgi:hypothetical protein